MCYKNSIIIFLLIIFTTNLVTATAPSKGESLYVKQIHIVSEDFYFLEWNNSQLTKIEYDTLSEYEQPFPMFILFNVTNNAKKIRMTLNDQELLNTDLSSLKTESYEVYRFPQKVMEFFSDKTLQDDDLSQFNNSNLQIFLDDVLVRSYTLAHSPAFLKYYVYRDPVLNTTYLFVGIITTFIIIFVSVVLVYKKLRK